MQDIQYHFQKLERLELLRRVQGMASQTLDLLLKSSRLGIEFWKPMVDSGRNYSRTPGVSYCFLEQNSLMWLLTCWFLVRSFKRPRLGGSFTSEGGSFCLGSKKLLESLDSTAPSLRDDSLLEILPSVTMFFLTNFLPLDDSSKISGICRFFFCLASPGIMEQVVDSSRTRSTIELQFLDWTDLRQSRVQVLKMPLMALGESLKSQLGRVFSHSSYPACQSPPNSTPSKSVMAAASQNCPMQFLTKQAQRCRKQLSTSTPLCSCSVPLPRIWLRCLQKGLLNDHSSCPATYPTKTNSRSLSRNFRTSSLRSLMMLRISAWGERATLSAAIFWTK